MAGKTVLYCAKRLSSIKNVQTIHVLKDGQVRETGTHDELVKNDDGIYRGLWDDYLSDMRFAKKQLDSAPEEIEEVSEEELPMIDTQTGKIEGEKMTVNQFFKEQKKQDELEKKELPLIEQPIADDKIVTQGNETPDLNELVTQIAPVGIAKNVGKGNLS